MKDLGERLSVVYISLVDGGQRFAELAELWMHYGSNESAEFIGDLAVLNPHSADFDGFHLMASVWAVPAGRLQITDDQIDMSWQVC